MLFEDLSLEKIIPVFLTALFTALVLTPVSILIARKTGVVDVPIDKRRMHDHPVPQMGGMAIYAATMLALLIYGSGGANIRTAMLGGTLIFILGLVDDKFNLHAGFKFACQTAVAVIMYAGGIRISLITNYFGSGHIHFNEVITFIFTVLWIVGITNTINLIDGLDGLAGGISAIDALVIAYIAYIHGGTVGMPVVCMAMVAIAGACIGFLPYNFFPAKTFMGDEGALFLGFMIAVLSVIGPLKRSTVIAVAAPVVALAIPIFDTSFAILRRIVNHRPIMGADKGHLHHRLMASGYGQRRAVIMMYGISAIMGMAAIMISRELYKEAFALACIAVAYLYVFLTDPNRKMPLLKAVKTDKRDREAYDKSGDDRQKTT